METAWSRSTSHPRLRLAHRVGGECPLVLSLKWYAFVDTQAFGGPGVEGAMPSPFPGMNPYLEQRTRWADFHTELLTTLRYLLALKVAPTYFVQIEEHIYIHDRPMQSRQRLGTADVSLVQPGNVEFARGGDVGLLEAPAEVWLPMQDVERVRYLEVRDREGREVVTVIELLSPSNKRAGDDRESYLAKRRELLRSPAHLVEIDLLRGWTPMPQEGRPECDYSVMVESRRSATDRGLLADHAEGPTAGHPHPAPAPRRSRSCGSPGSARRRL